MNMPANTDELEEATSPLRVLLIKLLLDANNGALPAAFDLRPYEADLEAWKNKAVAEELRQVKTIRPMTDQDRPFVNLLRRKLDARIAELEKGGER